ncbi:AarF/ABC1/UbiB kinase family protein, partial [Acinetobacter baumannii]|nr:AarF/ABC1/UbiB kinase family protein [Acinetobacter baumannii]
SKLLARASAKIISGAFKTNSYSICFCNDGWLTDGYGIKFPRDFALLFKQMLYFDRFMRVLAPYTDIYADQRLKMVQNMEPASLLKH